jgi:lysophospholipase L1-like esterase
MSATRIGNPMVLVAKLAASLILTALLFVAIEFVAGFFLLPREAISSKQSSADDTVSATLAWLWINPAPLREDPDFLWRNEPLATRTQHVNPEAYGSTAEWTIENNSSGFRGPEIRRDSSAEDPYRVLCIGDSVTFGFNADQDDSYPAQLEGFLRARQPGRDIEIINAGVPGWTWLQGVRFLERRGLALEPDLVIIAHGVNDQLMRALVTDAERLEHADNALVKWIAKMRLLVAGTNISYLIEQQIDTRPPPVEPSPGCQEQIKIHPGCKRVSPEEIEVAVARAHQLAESSGIDLLVLNLDFMKTEAAGAAGRAAEAAGVTFVDHVQQMDFLRARAQSQRSDALGLRRTGDQASEPWQDPYQRERQVIFRVQTPDAEAAYSARGRAVYSVRTYDFDTPLNDEGLDGDEKPGDGVFSGTLKLPTAIGALSYMFFRGEDREFRSLPPLGSSFGDRSLHVDDLFTTPVHRFAERFMMTEQTHPNAEGYGMIADAIAFEIWKRPSFQR